MARKHFLVHHRFHDNIAHLVDILQKEGFETKLFVILKTQTETYDLADPIISPKSSLTGLWQKCIKRPLQAYLPSFRSVFREYRRDRPEYVLLRPFVSGIGLVHFLCALWYCKKIILYSQSPKFRALNRKNDLFLKLVLMIPKAVWMTPVLYRDKSFLEKKITPHKKIHYLQLPHRRVERKTTWFKGGVVNLLLVAKAQSYKNHKVLIEALSKVNTKDCYQLNIAGDYSGEDEYTLEILNLLEKANINHNLLGYVRHDRMGDLYRENDLVVLPSSYEMHGYAVNEAIAYGLPVIVSSNVGTICLVRDSENGFVFESNNTSELTAIFDRIFSDIEQLKAMSDVNQQVFKEELSEEGFYKEYLALLG